MSNKIIFSENQIDIIIKKYTEDKWSLKRIGKLFGCSFSPIRRILTENNIEIRKDKKYFEGSIVGPYGVKLLERIKPINNGKDYLCNFECPFCHESFEAWLYNVSSGDTRSCGCYQKKYTLFQKKDLTGKRFGKLVVLKESNKKKPHLNGGFIYFWDCVCDCGRETTVSRGHLTSGHTMSCGKCCISKGENKIKNILNDLNIKYEQQKRFKECRDKKPLPFDFYLPDYNCCIEYDGEQHFHVPKNKSSSIFTEEKINEIQFHDKIKNKYCSKNNIYLIRIPYTDFNILNTDYFIEQLSKISI